MGGEPDDRLGSEDAPGQGGRRIVLAHVHAVGADLEGEVRAVVHDERDTEARADATKDPGTLEELACFEPLVAELDDVDPAAQAGAGELGKVVACWGAEVEAPTGEVGAQAEGRRPAPARAGAFFAAGRFVVVAAAGALPAAAAAASAFLAAFMSCL